MIPMNPSCMTTAPSAAYETKHAQASPDVSATVIRILGIQQQSRLLRLGVRGEAADRGLPLSGCSFVALDALRTVALVRVE